MKNNHESLPDDEHWDCPTCLRPMPPECDHRCSTCDMFASQHISATSLCRLLREAIAREDKLVIEVEKLKAQLDQIGEQYRLSSVCRDLKLENEKLKAQLEEKETHYP